MKTLIFINGPMGVGKTAVCNKLLEQLQPGVYLDGDWCWNMRPFRVTEETKKLVLDNIVSMLDRFLCCSELDYVLFSWVMHETHIVDDILKRINAESVKVNIITLMCREQTLSQRLEKDVSAGLRQPDVIGRAFDRLACCARLPYPKVWTDGLSVEEIAEQILVLLWAGGEYRYGKI